MSGYKLKTPKGIERTVVGVYQKIERSVVGAYQKIEDKFVETFLEKADEAETQPDVPQAPAAGDRSHMPVPEKAQTKH